VDRALRQQAEPEPEPQPAVAAVDGAPPDLGEVSAPVQELISVAETVAPPAAATVADAASTSGRRFEFVEGVSRKFWQIDRRGTDVTVMFGRIGTQGQTQLKQFSSEPRAQQEVDKLVAEKLRKGYAEIAR
jgi:predicted DNA-binding WGR domain protein